MAGVCAVNVAEVRSYADSVARRMQPDEIVMNYIVREDALSCGGPAFVAEQLNMYRSMGGWTCIHCGSVAVGDKKFEARL